jgi:NAD(P)-dependent dehydrogenase (short-subunit alcohol dehydrogenase family)
MNLFDLTGKTAVIIGGNSVLGGEMAVALGGHGADVAIIGRNMNKANAVCERVEKSGGKAACFQADATNIADLKRVLSKVLEWSGRVDVLMNCPGKNSTTPFFELTMEEWDSIMDVNLKSVVLACQVFGKYMVEQGCGGSIINISSVSSAPPLSRVFAYSASKAAVNNVTKFLASEFAPYKVRVNAIIPGFFPAEQNRKILTPDRVESILCHTPFGRFGDPQELQGTAMWLASEKASGFVTGALIRVDGGFGAMTI